MPKPPPPYTTPEEFFFNTPPYDLISVANDDVRQLFLGQLRVDGYCPFCRQQRTFMRTSAKTDHWFVNYINGREYEHSELHLMCTRDDHHVVRFYYLLTQGGIQKTGQYPSFADIALDESKQYSKQLSPRDTAEFHRAIGLAAHNVGIGSFVYLRRIFERLIDKRYKDFKDTEGWKDEDFFKLRMTEKVTFLRDHLPPFLVKNAKIYSILSLGLHELTEEECLSFFNVLRQSTVFILEQDKKMREELERQKELEKAIGNFTTPAAEPEHQGTPECS